MSGLLKTFFDRFTDITHDHPEVRNMLKGQHTYLLSVGSAGELPEGFEVPFRDTANYFDMVFRSSYYFPTKDLGKDRSFFIKLREELLKD